MKKAIGMIASVVVLLVLYSSAGATSTCTHPEEYLYNHEDWSAPETWRDNGDGTCTVIEHGVVERGCSLCGTVLYHNDDEQHENSTIPHEFSNGICIHCEAVCTHPEEHRYNHEDWSAPETWRDNGDGTCTVIEHGVVERGCSLCGTVLYHNDDEQHENSTIPHEYENGVCIHCGFQDPSSADDPTEGPAITTQPTSVSVAEGQKATFKVVASGTELTYQWYYQKPEESTWNQVSVNGTAATYSLTTAAQHNGYQYCCQVTNSAGTVTSSVATLTVETVTKPTIITQPTDISVNAGETATFKVVASGTELTYQWYYQKPGESTWNKVSSNGTAATYSLTTAARHNGYTYRCQVTNSAGSVYSDTATLTVATPVKITAQPQSVTVAKAGDTAKTTVTATGDGLTYQWYVKDPGSSSFTKSSNTTKSYSVALTEAKSGRQVYCVVTDQYGNTVQSSTATLSILSKPTITTQPKSVSVAEGKTATFKVVASGTGLSYQWYYQKPGESTWTAVSVNGTAATYSLTTAARHNGYTYRCKVTNSAGSVYSSTATLTVVSKPTISTQPKSVSVAEGQKGTFKVVASGTGLTYQWYYQKPGESTWNKVSVNGTAATYSLTAAARHNGYTYRCKVINTAGSVYSSTVTLTVAAGVKITAQPKSVTVAKAGDTARTTVTAAGEGLTYQWYVKDPGSSSFTKSSNTTKTYSVALTAAKSGRQVYCVVGDKYGNTVKSNTVTLTIE